MYQELGRAVRHGGNGNALIFFSKQQVRIHHIHIAQTQSLTMDERKIFSESMVSVERMCGGNECRWKIILDYFKQGKENFTCKNCDICWEETDRVTIDITDIAKHILSLLKNTELGRSALQKI